MIHFAMRIFLSAMFCVAVLNGCGGESEELPHLAVCEMWFQRIDHMSDVGFRNAETPLPAIPAAAVTTRIPALLTNVTTAIAAIFQVLKTVLAQPRVMGRMVVLYTFKPSNEAMVDIPGLWDPRTWRSAATSSTFI
ncbi:MAG TPA: hypothetical protein EYN66_13275 [Myxococcales bacterium]|nr:hypothetical protein [Myxococcales bacterium]